MRFKKLAKFIAAALLLSAVFCTVSFAAVNVTDTPQLTVSKVGPADDRFPFVIATDAEDCDKLCYAGHMTGGGIFYDDGKMILPSSKFGIVAQGGTDAGHIGEISAEITLLYENAQNSGCTREIVRKYPKGSFSEGKICGFLSDSAIKNLTQRKKLYSSDLSSIRVTLSYQGRTKTALFYVAKDADYAAALKKK